MYGRKEGWFEVMVVISVVVFSGGEGRKEGSVQS